MDVPSDLRSAIVCSLRSARLWLVLGGIVQDEEWDHFRLRLQFVCITGHGAWSLATILSGDILETRIVSDGQRTCWFIFLSMSSHTVSIVRTLFFDDSSMRHLFHHERAWMYQSEWKRIVSEHANDRKNTESMKIMNVLISSISCSYMCRYASASARFRRCLFSSARKWLSFSIKILGLCLVSA